MRGALRPVGIVGEQVAVVLEMGSAARGVGNDRVERARGRPGPDVGARRPARAFPIPHVMNQRAAAPAARHHGHIATQPREKANRRLVDPGGKDLLRATVEQGDPQSARARRTVDAGRVGPGRRLQAPGRHGDQAPQGGGKNRAQGPRHHGGGEHEAKAAGMGQDQRQTAPEDPFDRRTGVVAFDMRPRMVDEMHVVHARRTGRGAGKAGQAAIDMAHGRGRGSAAVGFPACP